MGGALSMPHMKGDLSRPRSGHPFGYAGAHGYQEDGDTGFKLLGHRFYDPSTGRFLTRDPIKDGTNWYAYCENNPLSRIDDQGLGWHDPVSVTVDEDFDGKVFVVGEPGPGKDQVMVELRPGETSPQGMDVDIIVVVYGDGRRQRRYFLPGINPAEWEQTIPCTYGVGAGGEVKCPWAWYPVPPFPGAYVPAIPIEFSPEPGQGKYLPGFGKGNWNDDINAAKRKSKARGRGR